MAKFRIRPATPGDIPSIVSVNLASTTNEETQAFTAPEGRTYASPEALRKVWAKENQLKDGSEVIVAEKNRNVVGFIVYKMESDHCYIDNIAITRNEQRKGMGIALVAHVEKLAHVNGHTSMKTDTTESAAGIPWKAYGFWTKLGYEDTGDRRATKWDFKTIPFVKSLN